MRINGSIFLQRDSNVLVVTEVLLFVLPKPCCLLGKKPNQGLVLKLSFSRFLPKSFLCPSAGCCSALSGGILTVKSH